MKLFHGSLEKFESFSFDKIGLNGTSEGKGFYMTTCEKIASGYGRGGYVYNFDLDVTVENSINDIEKKIPREGYERLIKVLDDELEYLSNYGEVDYEGYEKVLNRALENEYEGSESDVEIISGLANACGSIEVVNRLVHELFGISYIVEENPIWGEGQVIVIALVPEVIKIEEKNIVITKS